MIYLQENDFLSVISQKHLDNIMDLDDENVVLDTCELTAKDEMFGYLNVRNDGTACFATPRIPIIVQMMVDITLYHAHSRVTPDSIPQLRVKRYNDAIQWLDKVAAGFIAPDLPVRAADEEPTPLRFGSTNEKTNHQF